MESADLLSAVALFDEVPPHQVEFLASVAVRKSFPTESYLFKQDEPADEAYVVTKGLVGLELPASGLEPIPVLSIGPTELLGISWMIPPYRWALSARAFQETSVIAFDAKSIRDEAKVDSELKLLALELVVRETAQRLQATRVQLLDLYENR